MMSAVRAFFDGLGKVLSSPGLVLWLWVVNLIVALPLAALIASSIEESIGGSLVHEKLRSGFDMGWYGEYSARAEGVETSFNPSIVGAGAFFDNVEAWYNGELFELTPALVGAGVVYALVWTLFLGGILHRYSEGAGLFRLGEFLAQGGSFFFRYLRLAVIAAIVYYGIYRFSGWLFAKIAEASKDLTAEENVLAYVVAGSVLVVFLLTFVNMAFDYAKIATYRENRRSMIAAMLTGFGFVLSNLGKTITLYYGLGALGILLLFLYFSVAPGVAQASTVSIAFAFLVGQAYLIAKLGLRLMFYASQLSLYGAVKI
jgi:hypothetical protein